MGVMRWVGVVCAACCAGGAFAAADGLPGPLPKKDAQAHPEKYENLQIRVCGWNVRWNDLPRREQDEYIRRAECIMR